MNRPTPTILDLDSAGRSFMLSWLAFDALVGRIPADVWAEAYGRAADYQTVVNARELLASEQVKAA